MATDPAAAKKMNIEVARVTLRTLSGVSFTCPGNQLTAIVGPSGCGKSTLLRIMAGLEQPDSGSILLGGIPPSKRQANGEIGLAFQNPTLMPWRTVKQNIALPLELRRSSRDDAIEAVLRLTELGDSAVKLPRALSGGQAQRVSLARALVTKPRFLLLDEPFTGLDFTLRRRLSRDMGKLLEGLDVTTVLVTHDPREALQMADHIVVLSAPPTSVIMEAPVLLERPRTLAFADPKFAALCEQVESTLDNAVGAAAKGGYSL